MGSTILRATHIGFPGRWGRKARAGAAIGQGRALPWLLQAAACRQNRAACLTEIGPSRRMKLLSSSATSTLAVTAVTVAARGLRSNRARSPK